MVQPLKNLPGTWDPGRTKLLHSRRTGMCVSAVIVQAPHRQDVIMSEKMNSNQWKIFNLPLPYVYYFINIEKYNDTILVHVKGIGSSISLKDPRTDYLRTIPLPNTGTGLYTCSMPFNIKEAIVIDKLFPDNNGTKMNMALVREICKAAIVHFWQEGFHYLEKVEEAHKRLYLWGGSNKIVINSSSIDFKPYDKWASLKIKDLEQMTWLHCSIHKDYVKPWVS